MTVASSAYWDDLVADLADPEFLRAYITESLRVDTIDRLVNDLDHAREKLGLSKADLARAISAEPAVIRRLLSSGQRNPTIGTLVEVAAALNLKVVLVPMAESERAEYAEPLRAGSVKEPAKLARRIEDRRRSRHSVTA
ncbi:helix-turn-helix domain-containing protein [Labedaea rhizosphaerae]|uniref:Helix-turn-helix protein n=1 Tax=Labedaea rhizosphaerae TaxID=598644 RepID=A0A4R6SB94_LABRH|nr:helix-turn-helix transcriptional regulator [Labedaea rhizosphaerae]TDP97210.1 helix-turn-helix protein [Labedaea rhizosphaerae]